MVLTPREWYDKHAQEYDATYENSAFFQIYKRVTWEKTIKPYLPQRAEARILDAGGGTGVWTVPLAEVGYHVTLADISEGMLEVARRKLAEKNLLDRVGIVQADLANMDMLESNSFDFVLCEGDPLSYCSDPVKGIGELVRVAREGGTIVASVDNLYWTVRTSIRDGQIAGLGDLLETGWEIYLSGALAGDFPKYSFRPGELVQRFQEAGCRVVKLVGKNMFSQGLGDRLKDPETFDLVTRLDLELCDDPYLIGLAGHIAIVCKKE